MVADLVSELIDRWPQVATIEFAVEDVPPSNPAAWEPHNVVVARIFPADRRRGLRDRIVVYRLPDHPALSTRRVGTMTRRVLGGTYQPYPGAAAGRDRRRDALTARRHPLSFTDTRERHVRASAPQLTVRMDPDTALMPSVPTFHVVVHAAHGRVCGDDDGRPGSAWARSPVRLPRAAQPESEHRVPG